MTYLGVVLKEPHPKPTGGADRDDRKDQDAVVDLRPPEFDCGGGDARG